MKAERIKQILKENMITITDDTDVLEEEVFEAIQQATQEERAATVEEVAGWLEQQAREFEETDLPHQEILLSNTANELRNREVK